jgi:DNA-binding SARP family transcriptional activator
VLEFRLLGPLEVLDGERPVRLGGPKQRAALAILLLSANRVVSVERLADDLYAGAPPVTAVTQVQRQVSELRKTLGAEAIETRSPGYVLHVEPGRLDLDLFERGTYDAAQALEAADVQTAADVLRRALELWRGAPLADLAYESFAQTAIARLEELRLAALEQRFDAELALGRHVSVLAELEALVWDHPLREGLRGQLMLALYRAGRQAEALDVYRRTRETLVEEFGIEPSPSLHELERRILTQDPSLELQRSAPSSVGQVERTLLVVPSAADRLEPLLSVAEPLARLPDRALLIARLLADQSDVASAAAAIGAHRASLEVPVRTAVFTSLEPARDVVRLATNYDVDLVLLDAVGGLDAGEITGDLAAIAERSPADLAVLTGPAIDSRRGSGVFVPFGGGDNDWAALELGAWLASAAQTTLCLVGTTADPTRGRRDASRLLADASLATQRVVGVTGEPLLADPTADALLAAVRAATVVVTGFPTRWRAEGLGDLRSALVDDGRVPVVLVHRGTRPGGLAPRESRTRFSWSLEP